MHDCDVMTECARGGRLENWRALALAAIQLGAMIPAEVPAGVTTLGHTRERTQGTKIAFHVRAHFSHASRDVALDGQVVKIGRVASAHLRLEDPSVARMHAVIEARTAVEAFIIDLGSPSGTFVNGQRVTKKSIQQKDVIKIGDVELVIVTITDVSAEVPR